MDLREEETKRKKKRTKNFSYPQKMSFMLLKPKTKKIELHFLIYIYIILHHQIYYYFFVCYYS